MHSLFVAFGIGFSAGLRTFTAPAVVCWAVHLGRLNLHGTPFSFMGSKAALVVFTLFALWEYIFDLLPKVPNRTSPPSLIARITSGSFCGGCLFAATSQRLVVGASLGGIGAMIGAFAGYHARRSLVQTLNVKDAMIAIPEDLVAIGLAWLVLFA